LLRCIALKAESAGKHVVAVDPRHTSQTCSGCGALVPKDLSVRIHDCPHCGLRTCSVRTGLPARAGAVVSHP
jgi:putative transposase